MTILRAAAPAIRFEAGHLLDADLSGADAKHRERFALTGALGIINVGKLLPLERVQHVIVGEN